MSMYTPTPDYYNDYLMHYGVKGMKWRHHKAKGLINKLHGMYDTKFGKSAMKGDPRYGKAKKKKLSRYQKASDFLKSVGNTQGLKREAKYQATKAKNAAKKAYNSARLATSGVRGKARAALNTQGLVSEAKYQTTKAKNTIKKKYNTAKNNYRVYKGTKAGRKRARAAGYNV